MVVCALAQRSFQKINGLTSDVYAPHEKERAWLEDFGPFEFVCFL